MELWLILAIVFLIIEFATPGHFFGLFFAVSSFVTYLVSLLILHNVWYLTIIFAVFSILSIFLLRPVLIKKFKVNETVRPSNIDSFLTKEGTVIETIEPHKKGKVQVESEKWLARTANEETIEVGSRVKIETIDGVTLVVSKIEE